MGVYMCSTGQHILFISVAPMRAFTCLCPPWDLTKQGPVWSNVTPRVKHPKPGYDFITGQRVKRA